MNEKDPGRLPDDWEMMLRVGLVREPPGFEQRVIERLSESAATPAAIATSWPARWRQRAAQVSVWLGLVTGAAIGAISLTGFVFGVWFTVAAA